MINEIQRRVIRSILKSAISKVDRSYEADDVREMEVHLMSLLENKGSVEDISEGTLWELGFLLKERGIENDAVSQLINEIRKLLKQLKNESEMAKSYGPDAKIIRPEFKKR